MPRAAREGSRWQSEASRGAPSAGVPDSPPVAGRSRGPAARPSAPETGPCRRRFSLRRESSQREGKRREADFRSASERMANERKPCLLRHRPRVVPPGRSRCRGPADRRFGRAFGAASRAKKASGRRRQSKKSWAPAAVGPPASGPRVTPKTPARRPASAGTHPLRGVRKCPAARPRKRVAPSGGDPSPPPQFAAGSAALPRRGGCGRALRQQPGIIVDGRKSQIGN